MQKQKPKLRLFEKRFDKIQKLGEGQYGKVYKVSNPDDPDNPYLALKKYSSSLPLGMDITALREVTILKEISHENIVKINELFYSKTSLYIAYEFIDCELSKIIFDKRFNITEPIIKNILKQILMGLNQLHKCGVLHRDIKPQNLLVKHNGTVKIADFGLARFIASPGKEMTGGVISSWYRPPELFFGAKYYSFGIDIWSVGCIFGEMVLKDCLFQGNGEIEVLTKIFSLLGIPNNSVWPDYNQLDNMKVFYQGDVVTIKNKFSSFCEEGTDLLEKMLEMDPNKRISAEDALKHPFIVSGVPPASNDEIASIVEQVKQNKF